MAKEKLSEYSAKRSFKATPEPAPKLAAPQAGPLMFVVQQHDASRMHWDFRLECDGVLKSWAVPKAPSLDPADKRMAVMTEDHPYDYASFEGVIPPKQYGAGEVIVWDCGLYSPDEEGLFFHDRQTAQAQILEGLGKGKLSILLRGEKLKGSFALVRMKDGKTWLLIKHKDRFVTKADVKAQHRSVLSGAAVSEMKFVPAQRIPATKLVPAGIVSPMPTKVLPMLAEIGESVFNHADWAWEPKLDGYRVLAFINGTNVKLQSRRGLDLSKAFPKIVKELGDQFPVKGKGPIEGNGMVLDGEIVAFDASGQPSFSALQNRVQLKTERELAEADQKSPAVFYCFDLLHFAGIDLRSAQYRDRRRYLAQCLLPSPLVQLVHASDDGVELHAAAVASGFEGVIGKRRTSTYETGKRTGAWLKVKPTQSSDFVVGGYTKGKGAREPLGALLVGVWDEGKLRYVSHVGSGFDDKTLARVKKMLEPLQRKSCPFAEKPPGPNPTTWVEPVLVAEIKYHEWTGDDHLRAPVFLRIRDDVDVREVRRGEPASKANPQDDVGQVLAQLESAKKDFVLEIGPHRVKLSSLDKVYWPADPALKQPAQTKRDLLRYLAQVSTHMLRHLQDRPLTMIRMPDGIGKQRFYQKHWEQAKPDFVDTVTIFSESNEESGEYLLCNNLPTLLWLAQSGTLEFHVWHSRATPGKDSPVKATDFATSTASLEESILNYPDFVVFDIDPYI
jgi:bifunctional non-homologous end joining protein LigD